MARVSGALRISVDRLYYYIIIISLGPLLFAVYCRATGDIMMRYGVPQVYHQLTLVTPSRHVCSLRSCQCWPCALLVSLDHFQNFCINEFAHWIITVASDRCFDSHRRSQDFVMGVHLFPHKVDDLFFQKTV